MAKSNRVGRATLGDGAVTTAYRAVIGHACAQCAGTIPPGALFSRRARHAYGRALGVATTTEPVCATCRPLRLEGKGGPVMAEEPTT